MAKPKEEAFFDRMNKIYRMEERTPKRQALPSGAEQSCHPVQALKMGHCQPEQHDNSDYPKERGPHPLSAENKWSKS
jgi:hypothetical protein